MGANLLWAQHSADYTGQSWVGLLVPAGCDKTAGNKANPSRANRESDLTVNGRTTTPAVDRSGTRGQSTALDPTANPPSSKGVMPQTGDVLAGAAATDPQWSTARKQARAMGEQCKVQPTTNRFALLLPDGRTLAFDDLANQAILKQMPSMPASGKNDRVFRVYVTGKLQGGIIALDSIRM